MGTTEVPSKTAKDRHIERPARFDIRLTGREAHPMNTLRVDQQHNNHHVVPLAIAGTTVIVATALLAGPVHLPFGGEDDPPAPTPHLAVGVGAAAETGRCLLSGHPTPGDVPAPACRPGGVDTTLVARSVRSAPPVPCFTQFRTWPGDVARPAGCD
jgi:hypothetical protein